MRVWPFFIVVCLPSLASATELAADRSYSDASGETACLAENVDDSPVIVRERGARIRDAPVRISTAFGAYGGSGLPGGTGGYFGSTDDKTPVGIGYAGVVSADVVGARPLFVNAQLFGFLSPTGAHGAWMGDVRFGYSFSRYGNSWAAMPVKHSRAIAYSCIFGRSDIAFTLGGKRAVSDTGAFTAMEAGMQLHLLRDLMHTRFGIDFDVMSLYDPLLRGFGAQVQYFLHIGHVTVSQTIGGLYHRGMWTMLGLGVAFDLG